jgi:hypothetical protein
MIQERTATTEDETWMRFYERVHWSGTQDYQGWVKDFMSGLPDFSELSGEHQWALGDLRGEGYEREFVLLAVAVARQAQESDSPRTALDGWWGYSGNAKPSYARTAFIHRADGLTDRLIDAGLDLREARKIARRRLRSAVRRLAHHLSMNPPEVRS